MESLNLIAYLRHQETKNMQVFVGLIDGCGVSLII